MLSDQEIFDAVQPHLPRKGHAYIWDTDPEYAKSVGIEVGTRWIVGEMHPEHTLAASRAVESAACAERDARIAELEKTLLLAKTALEYHTQQTRPIHATTQIISAIDAAIKEQT